MRNYHNYSVILLFDPIDETVFYVMKVLRSRVACFEDDLYRHQYSIYNPKKQNIQKDDQFDVRDRILRIRAAGKEPIVHKIEDHLDIESAYKLEMYLIHYLGRKNMETGSLLNLTPGGRYRYPTKSLSNQLDVDDDAVYALYPELRIAIQKIKNGIDYTGPYFTYDNSAEESEFSPGDLDFENPFG